MKQAFRLLSILSFCLITTQAQAQEVSPPTMSYAEPGHAMAVVEPVDVHLQPGTLVSETVETGCSSCKSGCRRSCWGKLKHWLSYRPARCTACKHPGCAPCYPPLYTYFLHRCQYPGYCAPTHHAECGCSTCCGGK